MQSFGDAMNDPQGADSHGRPHGVVVPAAEDLPAMVSRTLIEATVGAVWTGHRVEKVAGSVVRQALLFELALIARACEIAVDQPGCQAVR